MPYIKQFDRDGLNRGDWSPSNAGELNYAITRLILDYMDISDANYHDYNEVVGVLESVKLEFYRRSVVPYEDKKIGENGDVYDR